MSESVTLDNPSLSEHDTKDEDTTDKDASANNKLTLCLLMYIIALAIMPADSLKQMLIKIGFIYSKDIGVGVLTTFTSFSIEVFGNLSVKDKVKGHTYANEDIYMYVTQSTPLLMKGRTCAVIYIHV